MISLEMPKTTSPRMKAATGQPMTCHVQLGARERWHAGENAHIRPWIYPRPRRTVKPAQFTGSQPGRTMADKSPRQHMSKQAGKSLKEKRAEKHAKADTSHKTEIVPPSKKR